MPASNSVAGETARPHILALDLTRVVVVAMVVGVHTVSIAAGRVSAPLGVLIMVFHSSREVFFLLTAFVLTYNYGRRREMHWVAFWRRRYLLVVPAYLVWSFIYFLADHEKLDPLSSAAAAFGRDLRTADARYQLYFLLVTMQLYLLFPALRWLMQKTVRHHLALFLGALAYELVLTVAIQHHYVRTGPIGAWLKSPDALLCTYIFYIVAGSLAAWYFERFVAFTRGHTKVVSASLIAGVGLAIGAYFAEIAIAHLTPAAASVVFQPAVLIESVAIAWALFLAGLCWAERGAPYRRVVSTGADSSFGIFLGHPLVLQGLLRAAAVTGALGVIREAPSAVEAVVLLGLAVPLIYGISAALVVVARRSPFSLVLTGRQRVRDAPIAKHARVRPLQSLGSS